MPVTYESVALDTVANCCAHFKFLGTLKAKAGAERLPEEERIVPLASLERPVC